MASELIPTVWSSELTVEMADTGSQQPPSSSAGPGSSSSRPRPPVAPRPLPVAPLRKPPQVVMIRKDEPAPPAPEPKTLQAPQPAAPGLPPADDGELFEMGSMEGLSMADLLGPDPSQRGQARRCRWR